jgi:uncharacterized sporulation protein YeaH/YhbH (DUF444 family)
MSADTPVSTSFIFIDRRKTGRGKSLPNRQRLLRRIKDSIKSAKPDDIDSGGVKNSQSSSKRQLSNPVKVAREALKEPNFMYAQASGERNIVLPGNDVWERGDEFPLSGGDEEQGSGGPGEDGDDDFVVSISKNEFYDVFFEDCELPDLEQTSEKELPEAVLKPAGFQKQGNAAQLSIVRSYRNSIGRRKALVQAHRGQLEELEAELMAYSTDQHPLCRILSEDELMTITADLMQQIEELKQRITVVPFFEKQDLRYRKSERIQVKSADAVLIMAMDISASMDEERKRIARKFFTLQYVFIARKYPNTDLVFIQHTDEAEEVTEEEFFESRKNGGTIMSPAIALAHKIIRERYDINSTNLYFSYAGDFDNWSSDNAKLISEIEESGFLNKIRHAVFMMVGDDGVSWSGNAIQLTWNAISSISQGSKKVHPVKIQSEDKVFQAFKKIYGRKASIKAPA